MRDIGLRRGGAERVEDAAPVACRARRWTRAGMAVAVLAFCLACACGMSALCAGHAYAGSGTSPADAIDASFDVAYAKTWSEDDYSADRYYYTEDTYYKVTMPSSGYLTLHATKPISSSGYYNEHLYLTVYDSSGSTVLWGSGTDQSKDNDDAAYRFAVGLAAGTYYVGVRPEHIIYGSLSSQITFGFAGERSGVAIENENNDLQERANALTLNKLTMGYIGSDNNGVRSGDKVANDNVDLFAVSLVAGRKYTVAAHVQDASGVVPDKSSNTVLYDIIAPDGSEARSDSNRFLGYYVRNNPDGSVNGLNYITFTAKQTGTYYWKVWSQRDPLAYYIGVFEGDASGLGSVSGYDPAWDPALNTQGGKGSVAVSCSISGSDRYETAANIAKAAYPDGAAGVVVATGENFPDALGASALAGMLGYPIVLTEPGKLSYKASSAISTLKAKDIIVVGGYSAVSKDVESALGAYGTVTRVSGSDRYATARALYEKGCTLGTWSTTAIVATGGNYPDALSISGYAFANAAPIFLTSSDSGLDATSKSLLQNGGFKNVIIVGGEKAVPNSDKAWLESKGISVQRLSGADRYETSKKIAEFVVQNGGTADKACIATGEKFPDALAGSSLAGVNRSVVLLAKSGSTSAFDVLGTGVTKLNFLGGTAALPNDVREAALAHTRRS